MIPRQLINEIRAQAQSELPNEACGYLGGTTDRALSRYAMRNVDSSPEHYSFDPAEQFRVLKLARDAGEQLIGVYHSHPQSPARMSAEDIRLALDPTLYYLIFSLPNDELRAYRVDANRRVSEEQIEVVEE